MSKSAAAAQPSAVGNWPLPEDRKSAVVKTDVARGLLTEEQARDACRGLSHPDTRIDTPNASNADVGGLAKEAAAAKQAGAEADYDPNATPDPARSGEAAARLLDEDIAETQEKVKEDRQALIDKQVEKGERLPAGELVTAEDKLAEAGEPSKRPEPVGNQ